MTATTAATRTPDCNHCRRRPAAPERTRCRPCLDKAAENSRKRYARLAANASCTRCGRCPSLPGESRCSACAHVPPKSWPRLVRSWFIETVGGCEFGPYHDEIEAHADAVFRRIERRFGEYAVYARTELDGTPDLDDIRTRLSFEIG